MNKLFYILPLFLLSSCGNTEFIKPKQNAVSEENYIISITQNRYGVVNVDKLEAKANETINITYHSSVDYVLSHYLINGINVGIVTSYVVTEDIMIEGVFKKAISDYDLNLAADLSGAPATSYWSFEYGEDSLKINTKVKDSSTVNFGNPKYQDAVEMLITTKDDNSWIKNKTYQFTCSRSGTTFVRKAISSTYLGSPIYDEEIVSNYGTADIEERYVAKNHGYTGYEVDINIPYSALGLNSSNAYGNIRLSIALQNSRSGINSEWTCYGEWLIVSTHYIVQ